MYNVAIFNRKGGVGKSTCAASLGGMLSRIGHKVLLVDLDSQANLTNSFLAGPVEEDVSCVYSGAPLPVRQVSLMMDIVPSSLALAAADYAIAGREDRYCILSRALAASGEAYDFAILDLPPAMNHIAVGAVAACDYIISPVLPDLDSLAGLRLVEEACRFAGKAGGIDGIVISCYSSRRRLDGRVEEVLRGAYGDTVFDTKIRVCNKLRECKLERMDIGAFAPNCTGAQDYRCLADEFLKRIQMC